jgi:hypothetical protein
MFCLVPLSQGDECGVLIHKCRELAINYDKIQVFPLIFSPLGLEYLTWRGGVLIGGKEEVAFLTPPNITDFKIKVRK